MIIFVTVPPFLERGSKERWRKCWEFHFCCCRSKFCACVLFVHTAYILDKKACKSRIQKRTSPLPAGSCAFLCWELDNKMKRRKTWENLARANLDFLQHMNVETLHEFWIRSVDAPSVLASRFICTHTCSTGSRKNVEAQAADVWTSVMTLNLTNDWYRKY